MTGRRAVGRATSPADTTLLWGFDGPTAPGALIDRARDGRLAGITLFRRHNVESPAQVRALVDELIGAGPGTATRSGPRPLVAIDQEGGQFLGLAGSTPFAGNLALGAIDDSDLTRRVGRAIGTELRAVGIDVDYAPVADVLSSPDNPALGVRSFGADPATVGRHVAALATGLAEAGVVAVAKHFPGAGEARSDPHHGLPALDVDRARLDRVELAPFRAAVTAGVGAVMVGHQALPGITGRADLPASVSPAVLGGLLRDDLGFDGVVVTDALDMGALTQGAGAVIEAVAALRAGVDLLLSPADLERAADLADGLDLAHRRGLLDDDGLAVSARRVAAIRGGVAPGPRPPLHAVGSADHRRLADEVAGRSITVVRDRAGLLPIAGSARVASIMVRPTELTPADTSSWEEPGLAVALRSRFGPVDELVVDHRPDGAQIAAASTLAAGADVAIVGTIDATGEQVALVRSVAEVAPTVVAALRTPFDLVAFPEIDTYLCTYGVVPPSLRALAGVLAGGPAAGRLPVDIDRLHLRGHGLAGPDGRAA